MWVQAHVKFEEGGGLEGGIVGLVFAFFMFPCVKLFDDKLGPSLSKLSCKFLRSTRMPGK